MSEQVLYLSKSVAATTEDCDTYVVPNGKTVKVIKFHGESDFSESSAVKLVWDVAGTPVILWSMKGSAEMPRQVPDAMATMTGDGVKKIALCLDNGEANAIFMSGHVILEVED